MADLPEIKIGEHSTALRRDIKYLGVTVDRNLSFSAHVRTVSERKTVAGAAVGHLTPNMEDPSMMKRALLQSVASRRLLYPAPVWAARATQYACNKDAMNRAQRLSALRVARCYRTVSRAVTLVLAGSFTADVMAIERMEIFWRRAEGSCDPEEAEKRNEYTRDKTLKKW